MNISIRKILLIGILAVIFNQTMAQNISEEEKYTKVINERARKIVSAMNLSNSSKALRVQAIIADQYRNLSTIHDEKDSEINAVKKQLGDDSKAAESQIKKIEKKADKKLKKTHSKYLAKLSKELTPNQVDQVKDGMTYGVLPLTYNGYLEMIPTLTEVQKKLIKDYLTEAREHAMDAGSSEDKHKWFGKYKGKINNYLSKEGYNLKEEEKGWAKRRKAKSETDAR